MKYIFGGKDERSQESLLAIAEWIEIDLLHRKVVYISSLLAIAEWIEILYSAKFMKLCIVSASDSGVD